MNDFTIREPGFEEARQLAAMLSEDEVLRVDLGMGAGNKPTPNDFLQKLAEWCPARRATTYAILAGNRAVGTISLSHRSEDGKSAQIGYWMGSRYRGRGYCTKAFAAVLAQAASEGIVSVSATIAANNTPSRRVWEGHGSVATSTENGRVRYQLNLDSKQSMQLTGASRPPENGWPRCPVR